MNVVRYDSATGARRDVLITAAQLTPPGAADAARDRGPVVVERRAARAGLHQHAPRLADELARRLLAARSAHRPAEEDRRRRAGGEPDVREVQSRRHEGRLRARRTTSTSRISPAARTTRLTHDGTDLVINGGSDWVNEEELDLHDCLRWSPDGARIAFWQFDTHGVGNFPLMYYLGKDREIVTHVPYPQTGPYRW